MGSNQSKTSDCLSSLLDRTKEDVARGIVEHLGSVYAPYSERIVQHNISGAVLWSFRKELYDEADQNLIRNILSDDLGITNVIHQRVLHLELVKIIQREEEIFARKEDQHEIPTNIVIQKSTASPAMDRSFIVSKSREGDESPNCTGIGLLQKASRTFGPPRRQQQYSSDSLETETTMATTLNTLSSATSPSGYPKKEIHQLKEAYPIVSRSLDNIVENEVILYGYGPIHDVTQLDVMQYEPLPTDLSKCSEADRNDLSSYQCNGSSRPRTSMLPIFHNEFSANRIENAQYMEHLPENYYSTLDELQIDHTPVHVDDVFCVAVLESFSLQEIKPSDPTGIALQRLTDLAAQMFDCDYVEVTFLTHDKFYSIATHSSLSEDALQAINSIKTTINFYENSRDKMPSRTKEPWLRAMERGLAFCNYVAYTGRTFTLNDVYADESFAWAREANAAQFYSASPIIVRGCNIASFCVYDFRRPHPEFSTAHKIQLEQLAAIATEHIEHWVLRLETKARGMEGGEDINDRRKSVSTLNSTAETFISEEDTFREIETHDPPEKVAAVILTDVQGSTSLWESNPEAMQEALNLHDHIMRQAIVNHRGYEIKTEGDSFQIVFHECCDAVLFALTAQKALHSAPWSTDILSHPIACEDTDSGLRGLRVRMAIHYGPVSYQLNEVSCRRDYTGSTINIAKSLENLAFGGQILITSDAWNQTSHLSPTILGSPQVLDLGIHILLTGSKKNEGIIEKCVLQLVPRALAFDYAFRRSVLQRRCSEKSDDDCTASTDGSSSRGRQFPNLTGTRRLSASFQDAPCEGNEVTILFLAAKNVEELYDDSALILSALAKHVSFILRQFPTAYQCKDLMLAFPCPSDAIRCGLAIQVYLRGNNTVAGVSLKNMIKIGLHHGPFTSMGPDLTTGRADYFGVVVNRAARIAEAAHPGEVVLGVMASSDCDEPPPLENGLTSTFVGRQALKGITEEIDLYNCFLEARKLKRTSSIRSSRMLLAL